MKKVTIELHAIVYELLQVLDTQGLVERVLETLADHAQQGVYRPGAWERDWLRQVFPERQWIHKLEPGDPYGRPDSPMFQRPKKDSSKAVNPVPTD